jgi:hypothetical protein
MVQQQHHQSAYQTTAANMLSARRSASRLRRGVESSLDLRPPPIIGPSTTGRRGSAPDPGHRRPLPVASPNRQSMPNGPSTRSNMRMMLPRLSTFGDAVSRPRPGPLSAPPPRTQSAQARFYQHHQRPRSSAGLREKEKSPKKKIGCVVM